MLDATICNNYKNGQGKLLAFRNKERRHSLCENMMFFEREIPECACPGASLRGDCRKTTLNALVHTCPAKTTRITVRTTNNTVRVLHEVYFNL